MRGWLIRGVFLKKVRDYTFYNYSSDRIFGVADIQTESKITGKIISIRGGLSTEVKEIMELSY